MARARDLATSRQGCTNARLEPAELDVHAPVDAAARGVLERALERGVLSGRGYHRVRRVARTVADVAGHEGSLGAEHVEAALALRADPLSPTLGTVSR